MTEAASVTTFVMGEQLPWTDDASAGDGNGPFESGVIHAGGSRLQCSILKISALGATVGGRIAKPAGTEVTVELAAGQRPAGTIDWVRGGEAGIRFKQPIDILALINRTLVSQPVERRTMPRVEIRCRAHLKFGATFSPALLRNISAGGLQLEGDALPPVGTYVAVFLEGLNIPAGEVIWRKDDLAGIELFDELSWSSIMPWIRDMVRRGVN